MEKYVSEMNSHYQYHCLLFYFSHFVISNIPGIHFYYIHILLYTLGVRYIVFYGKNTHQDKLHGLLLGFQKDNITFIVIRLFVSVFTERLMKTTKQCTHSSEYNRQRKQETWQLVQLARRLLIQFKGQRFISGPT